MSGKRAKEKRRRGMGENVFMRRCPLCGSMNFIGEDDDDFFPAMCAGELIMVNDKAMNLMKGGDENE